MASRLSRAVFGRLFFVAGGSVFGDKLRMPVTSLTVSTRNVHKLREIQEILGSGFQISGLTALPDFPEIAETGRTFEENATLKAVAASGRFDGWVIADDSGLEVDALAGAPGVRSARYAGPAATDQENNTLLLESLARTGGHDRSARFRCVIVLARSGRKLAAFSGVVEGSILRAPDGKRGFGYDPLFVPSGFRESFGQLPPEVKNRLSHRARALEGLRAWQGFF